MTSKKTQTVGIDAMTGNAYDILKKSNLRLEDKRYMLTLVETLNLLLKQVDPKLVHRVARDLTIKHLILEKLNASEKQGDHADGHVLPSDGAAATGAA